MAQPERIPSRQRKIGMKSKIFSGGDPAAIIQAVNDWLAGEKGVVICDTEMSPAAAGGGPMTFRVWYEQDEKTG